MMKEDLDMEQPAEETAAATTAASLKDALPLLRAPGVFDSLRPLVEQALADRDTVSAPFDLR